MTELLRIFDEIYRPQLQYCVICLRSERERRLVDASNLEQFIKSINLPYSYTRAFQRICWICDRAATAAVRFRLAVNLSSSLHALFSLLARTPRHYEDTAAQLRGTKPAAGVVRPAAEWQARLRAVRARSVLLQTEVLVVASVPPAGPRCEADVRRPSEQYLLPHEAPAPAPAPAPPPRRDLSAERALSEPEIFVESVILEDDERDPIDIKQESSFEAAPPPTDPGVPLPADPGIPPGSSILQKILTNGADESFLLHPIVESGGAMSVPSLGAHIVGGRLVVPGGSHPGLGAPRLALQCGGCFNLMTDPEQVTNYLNMMKPSEVNKVSVLTDTMPLHVLEANVHRMQLLAAPTAAPAHRPLPLSKQQLQVTNPRSQLSSPNEALNGAPCVVDSDIQNLLSSKPIANKNIITHSIILEDAEEPDPRGGKRRREGGHHPAEPQGKPRETDWEDKIPMDVISYMDATDPHATILDPEPPLGVITDVHTLSEPPPAGGAGAGGARRGGSAPTRGGGATRRARRAGCGDVPPRPAAPAHPSDVIDLC